MARIARANQGQCQMEFDLHRSATNCEKNGPDHKKFIPIYMFSKEHLPHDYHDEDLVACIKALADLTIHIKCPFTSKGRPETYPESDQVYPFSDCEGRDKLRLGTGWILHVNKEPRPRNKSCPCQECHLSSSPKPRYAEIEIRTAAHIVYDLAEGRAICCNLFFDKGGIPNPSTSITLPPGSVVRVERDFDGDISDLTCITHDLELADRLERAVELYESLHLKAKEKYQEQKQSEEQSQATGDNKLVVIVSHPHGCSKMVSVGQYKEIQKMDCRESLTRYIYDTATCSGSSGAPVFILRRSLLWLLCEHPHSGSIDDLNYSGFALD